jgi:hypothetical protein
MSGFFAGAKPSRNQASMCVELRQLLQGIADHQRQGHPAAIEAELLEAWVDGHVLLQQRAGVRGELWPQLHGPRQVVTGQGTFRH